MKKIIKNLSGSVLGIGINEELSLLLNNNKNISNLTLLEKNSFSKTKNKGKKNKVIHIKKIKKYFKKNSLDYIICDFEVLNKYFNSFVNNAVVMCKNKIYFTNGDVEKIKYRFKNYNCSIKEINNLIEIDVSTSKSRGIFKTNDMFIYRLTLIIEIIGDVLMN